MHSQLSPHELAYQESLIQEREAEIEEIESGIHELAEIFRDLGTLVNQQGGMLGRRDRLPPFLTARLMLHVSSPQTTSNQTYLASLQIPGAQLRSSLLHPNTSAKLDDVQRVS
jgi:hypothetical protein